LNRASPRTAEARQFRNGTALFATSWIDHAVAGVARDRSDENAPESQRISAEALVGASAEAESPADHLAGLADDSALAPAATVPYSAMFCVSLAEVERKITFADGDGCAAQSAVVPLAKSILAISRFLPMD